MATRSTLIEYKYVLSSCCECEHSCAATGDVYRPQQLFTVGSAGARRCRRGASCARSRRPRPRSPWACVAPAASVRRRAAVRRAHYACARWRCSTASAASDSMSRRACSTRRTCCSRYCWSVPRCAARPARARCTRAAACCRRATRVSCCCVRCHAPPSRRAARPQAWRAFPPCSSRPRRPCCWRRSRPPDTTTRSPSPTDRAHLYRTLDAQLHIRFYDQY